MSGPLYLPTTELVAQAWLRLASGVHVDLELPEVDGHRTPADLVAAVREHGAIRLGTMPGSSDPYVPMHAPVVVAECWVPPDRHSPQTPWLVAAQIAQRVWNATYDPALMGVEIDLSDFGSYMPARVHNVIALGEPERNEEDPDDWARYDVDLAFTWTQGA